MIYNYSAALVTAAALAAALLASCSRRTRTQLANAAVQLFLAGVLIAGVAASFDTYTEYGDSGGHLLLGVGQIIMSFSWAILSLLIACNISPLASIAREYAGDRAGVKGTLEFVPLALEATRHSPYLTNQSLTQLHLSRQSTALSAAGAHLAHEAARQPLRTQQSIPRVGLERPMSGSAVGLGALSRSGTLERQMEMLSPRYADIPPEAIGRTAYEPTPEWALPPGRGGIRYVKSVPRSYAYGPPPPPAPQPQPHPQQQQQQPPDAHGALSSDLRKAAGSGVGSFGDLERIEEEGQYEAGPTPAAHAAKSPEFFSPMTVPQPESRLMREQPTVPEPFVTPTKEEPKEEATEEEKSPSPDTEDPDLMAAIRASLEDVSPPSPSSARQFLQQQYGGSEGGESAHTPPSLPRCDAVPPRFRAGGDKREVGDAKEGDRQVEDRDISQKGEKEGGGMETADRAALMNQVLFGSRHGEAAQQQHGVGVGEVFHRSRLDHLTPIATDGWETEKGDGASESKSVTALLAGHDLAAHGHAKAMQNLLTSMDGKRRSRRKTAGNGSGMQTTTTTTTTGSGRRLLRRSFGHLSSWFSRSTSISTDVPSSMAASDEERGDRQKQPHKGGLAPVPETAPNQRDDDHDDQHVRVREGEGVEGGDGEGAKAMSDSEMTPRGRRAGNVTPSKHGGKDGADGEKVSTTEHDADDEYGVLGGYWSEGGVTPIMKGRTLASLAQAIRPLPPPLSLDNNNNTNHSIQPNQPPDHRTPTPEHYHTHSDDSGANTRLKGGPRPPSRNTPSFGIPLDNKEGEGNGDGEGEGIRLPAAPAAVAVVEHLGASGVKDDHRVEGREVEESSGVVGSGGGGGVVQQTVIKVGEEKKNLVDWGSIRPPPNYTAHPKVPRLPLHSPSVPVFPRPAARTGRSIDALDASNDDIMCHVPPTPRSRDPSPIRQRPSPKLDIRANSVLPRVNAYTAGGVTAAADVVQGDAGVGVGVGVVEAAGREVGVGMGVGVGVGESRGVVERPPSVGVASFVQKFEAISKLNKPDKDKDSNGRVGGANRPSFGRRGSSFGGGPKIGGGLRGWLPFTTSHDASAGAAQKTANANNQNAAAAAAAADIGDLEEGRMQQRQQHDSAVAAVAAGGGSVGEKEGGTKVVEGDETV
ncbi:unnamed protein product [Vitrella brassicaformis CCMP3155]|uniref:Uncharacterized protein n=3 Tax=Vitrella brassicaformis TaxID=1169539 RepID=A0A0G4EF44_VITBC|nr:unnamed protein product [Vitrella brassicaformis CCMP3155]|eukprot:CEL94035.1 unnamed protein product [Vitrella brassicaformis CCMP3155]